jgi:carbonic anhydrase
MWQQRRQTLAESLIDGYRRFREGYYREHREQLEALAAGQSPRIAVVSCCDSRVDPAVVFDARPGDLFVIRNVASLVPPSESEGLYHGTSAALEFAVTGLGVEHIVVLGHAQCGGVRAMLEGHRAGKRDSHTFIERWVSMGYACLDELVQANRGEAPSAKAAEQAAVRLSLKNLRTFPWVAERLEAGTLTLHGWYYDLATSTIERLETLGGIASNESITTEHDEPK